MKWLEIVNKDLYMKIVGEIARANRRKGNRIAELRRLRFENKKLKDDNEKLKEDVKFLEGSLPVVLGGDEPSLAVEAMIARRQRRNGIKS